VARRTGLLPPGAARGWTGGFEREVRAALARLHDPAGLRVDRLLRFLRDTRPDDAGAGGALRADLLGGLTALEAQPRGGRLHQLLRRRYVDGLSAPVVQADLAIGKSAYYRQHDRAVAALAESVLSRLCRVLGGGAYTHQSPFAYWYEDVRALSFLRPPWALAFDTLWEALRPGDPQPSITASI
jgi:hypothetical protein